MKLPADLKPESVLAIIDSREQAPLDLSPLRMERGTLTTGDYSIAGLESVIAIERKSLPDLLACIGQERERFEREIQRLMAFPCRCLIIESTWAEIEAGEWRSKVTSASVIGSLMSWLGGGLPVLLAGDHARAGRYASRLLYLAARRRWREARALAAEICEPECVSV